MLVLSEITRSFPSARLPSAAGGLPVEVVLVAQLDHGVVPLDAPPAGSLLLRQFAGQRVHHDDTFALAVERGDVPRIGAAELLARLLDGFLENAPAGVSRMMALRNDHAIGTLPEPVAFSETPRFDAR